MRKAGLLMSIAVAATVLVGCGGGGGNGNSNNVNRTIRTVAGFVYVKGTGGGTPQVAVLPTANPPAGYFPATGGTVTVSVADGVITRAPDSENFSMATSNAIVCTVEGPVNSNVTLSAGAAITGVDGSSNALTGTLTTFNTSLGVDALEGTVLTLNNGPTNYTPGPTTSMRYTIDGLPIVNPTVDFILGDAPRLLSVIGLDASGVIVPTQVFTVTASTNGAVVTGGPSAFTLNAGNAVATTGPLTVDIDATGANLQASIDATFGLGTVTSITLNAATTPIVWGVTSVPAAIPNTTSVVTATVLNQNAVPMPGVPVTLTTDKAPANLWTGAPGVSGSVTGTIFTATNTGNSDANGQFIATFNPPAAVDGPLTGADLVIKGVNVITATAGAVNNTTNVTIERPFGSFTIAGPLSFNINSVSPNNFTTGYRIDTALDVDNEALSAARLLAAQPLAAWTEVNSASLPAQVGDPGDQSAPTDASTASSFSGNVLTIGSVPGMLDVTATVNGVVSSNILNVGVFGQPSKIVLVPAPALAGGTYTGPAAGSAYAGTANTALGPVTISVIDSGGNNVTGTVTGFASTVSVVSGSGATLLTAPSANPFNVQAGTADGAFSIVVTGSGLTGAFNINRTVGIDLP